MSMSGFKLLVTCVIYSLFLVVLQVERSKNKEFEDCIIEPLMKVNMFCAFHLSQFRQLLLRILSLYNYAFELVN